MKPSLLFDGLGLPKKLDLRRTPLAEKTYKGLSFNVGWMTCTLVYNNSLSFIRPIKCYLLWPLSTVGSNWELSHLVSNCRSRTRLSFEFQESNRGTRDVQGHSEDSPPFKVIA